MSSCIAGDGDEHGVLSIWQLAQRPPLKEDTSLPRGVDMGAAVSGHTTSALVVDQLRRRNRILGNLIDDQRLVEAMQRNNSSTSARVRRGKTMYGEWAGEHQLVVEAVMDLFLHSLHHTMQVTRERWSLVQAHISATLTKGYDGMAVPDYLADRGFRHVELGSMDLETFRAMFPFDEPMYHRCEKKPRRYRDKVLHRVEHVYLFSSLRQWAQHFGFSCSAVPHSRDPDMNVLVAPMAHGVNSFASDDPLWDVIESAGLRPLMLDLAVSHSFQSAAGAEIAANLKTVFMLVLEVIDIEVGDHMEELALVMMRALDCEDNYPLGFENGVTISGKWGWLPRSALRITGAPSVTFVEDCTGEFITCKPVIHFRPTLVGRESGFIQLV